MSTTALASGNEGAFVSNAVLGPGAVEWLGTHYRTTLTTTETKGAMSILDSVSPPGFGPPRHIHHDADEAFVILTGDAEFWLAGERFARGPGETVFIPRETEHTFRIVGDLPCRHLVILTPGWIERVFTQGWAYKFGDGIEDRGKGAKASLLGNKPTVLIDIAGSKQNTYEKYGYDDAMRTQIDVGTFAYCGITDVESHLIFDVEGDHNAANREAGLNQARAIAQNFISPGRVPRDAKAEHFKQRVA